MNMKFHITKDKKYLLIQNANLKTVEVLGPARLAGKVKRKSPIGPGDQEVFLFRLIDTGELVRGDTCFWWFYDEMRRELGQREIKYVKPPSKP